LNPTPILLRLSVGLAAVAGFGVGLWLLWALALGQAATIPFAALAQAHGQVQLLGFVGLFVLGAAAQLLPGFLTRPLRGRTRVIAGGYVLAASLALRLVAQPADPGLLRNLGLWLSALGEIAGVGLSLSSYLDLLRHTIQPRELWRRLAEAGFGFLVASVLLNLVAVATLATGAATVPEPLDAALVQLELWGFFVLVVWAITRKILSRFLLLPPPQATWVRRGALLYVGGVIVVAGGWLAELAWPSHTDALIRGLGAYLQLAGVVFFLSGMQVFRAPVRSSGAPNVTEPARRWIRFAFGWLLVGAIIEAAFATRFFLGGPSPGFFDVTAARHALGQGFALTILIGLGSRILPGFSAWAIERPRLIELVLAAVTLGATLRVLGELGVTTAGAAAEPIAAAGGTIGVAAFLVFGVSLAWTVGRGPGRPPAMPKRSPR
jgi:hypothetical protein